MFTFILSIVIAVLSAIGIIALISYYTNKKEQQEFKKWLDKVDKELREREVKKNG